VMQIIVVPIIDDPGSPHPSLGRTRPTNQILEPLRTCRQFYREVMPTFYRINTFYFRDFCNLYSFLHHMPACRRQHLLTYRRCTEPRIRVTAPRQSSCWQR
jgi:hypothetical protein